MTRAGARTGTRLAVGALAGVLLLAGCGATPENKVRDKIGDVTEAVNDYTDDRASAQDVFDALSSLQSTVTVNAPDIGAARVTAITQAAAKLRADVEQQEAANQQPSPEPSLEPSVEPPPASEEPEEDSPEPELSEEPEESPAPPPARPSKSPKPKPKPSPSKPAAAVSASPVAASKPKASPARSAPSAAPSRAAAASRSPATPTAALTA